MPGKSARTGLSVVGSRLEAPPGEGSSATADLTEPENLAAVLNEYLSETTEIAERPRATIDKFLGHAVAP